MLLEHLYHKPLIDPDELYKELISYKEMVEPYVCNVSLYLYNANQGRKEHPAGRAAWIIEGSGSRHLPDGYIFFNTAAYGAIGAGIPPMRSNRSLRSAKHIPVRLEQVLLLSEIFGDEAEELRNRGGDGGEYGGNYRSPETCWMV